MLYKWKLRLLKLRWINALWRRARSHSWRGGRTTERLRDCVRQYAPGQSFADIGCMWGVNGEYAFVAAEAGATIVKGVDVFGPTPEFEQKNRERGSRVEFILGDASRSEIARRIGVLDVVFCSGVLYHHPSPFDLLVALRRICGKTLILTSMTIPEVPGFPNVAVYYPGLPEANRKIWDLSGAGVGRQIGITDGFEPAQGYGNWFWGMTPSCVTSMLATAGFRVDRQIHDGYVQIFVCSVTSTTFRYMLPDDQ